MIGDKAAMLRRVFLAMISALAAFPAVAAGPAPGGGGNQQASFVRLPVINANVIRSNRTRGVLSIESGVDVPDGYPPCPSLRGQPCRTYVPVANQSE